MLIPQFSLRWLLATVTGCSLAFLVVSLAVRGNIWAIGASFGLLALVVLALMQGFTFFLVWLFAGISRWRKAPSTDKTAAFLGVLLSSAIVQAGGAVHILPPSGKPAKNGMVLTLDTTWPEGFGYRPVSITVNCTPPSPADRTLSFEFGFHDWNPSNVMLKASATLEVPANATTASTTIPVPDFLVWQGYSLDTWEDGRHNPALSASNLAAGGTMTIVGPVPAALFVGTTPPAMTTLGTVFQHQQYQYAATNVVPGPPPFPMEWAVRAPSTLPDEWLCYQNLDVIFIALSDLSALANSSPRTFTALRSWVRTGGNLIISGVGSDWSRLAEIDKLFNEPSAESDGGKSLWQVPGAENYRSTFSDIASPNVQPSQIVEVDETGAVITAITGNQSLPKEAPFRLRVLQQGTLVALGPDDPYTSWMDANLWYWVFNSLGSNRWLAAKRTGISFAEENPDFWTFLVPGVGGAPVDAYRVLITMFVIVIGPVNYLVLRKHGRLHLLLLTVPISALLVTGTLLAYALVADGLQTRVRSRSFTMLDQRSGDAVSWSRLAYYSGLSPSEGLRFSRATAAIPYEQLPSGAGGRQLHRTIDIETDHQQLERGWLPSRTPVQLMTIRPSVFRRQLKVASQEKSIVVENQLGVAIAHLLVRDEAGNFGYGSAIAESGRAVLNAVAVRPEDPATAGNPPQTPDLAAPMRKAFADQTLTLPDGFAHDNNPYGLFGFRRRYVYYNSSGAVAVTQSSSRLELGLEQAKSAVIQAGVNGDAVALVPRSYIAIVERPEEVELGLEGATETPGFHVIRGNW